LAYVRFVYWWIIHISQDKACQKEQQAKFSQFLLHFVVDIRRCVQLPCEFTLSALVCRYPGSILHAAESPCCHQQRFDAVPNFQMVAPITFARSCHGSAHVCFVRVASQSHSSHRKPQVLLLRNAIHILLCLTDARLRSDDSEVYNFGKQLLDSMPPHSLLTTLGDLQHNSVKCVLFHS
jgi:hypothetical protein